jgi:ABC-2 type transport system ATP-binding protein
MLVVEYLQFVGRLRELSGPILAQATDEAVVATGIEGVFHRPIGELSKGYRQRVGLAAAILHRPDLLVLDEPTEGLDPNQRVEIRRLIGTLGKDRTVLLSTHILPEVQHTCSRLLIINRGRLAADGPMEELLTRAGGQVRISVEVDGAGALERLGALPGVVSASPIGSAEETAAQNGRVRVMLTASSASDLRPEIFRLATQAGWTLYELHQEAGSLEDLFRQLTAEEEPAAAPAEVAS